MNSTTIELNELLNRQREEAVGHTSHEDEFLFYRRIARGDLSVLEGKISSIPEPGMGVLSSDGVRNAKYHLIILVTMITRFCVEAGLPLETAYSMSDIFIRRIDVSWRYQELDKIKRDILSDYVTIMHNRQRDNVKSLQVMRAINYIEKNLTSDVSVVSIADAIGVNSEHLSRLFKKETGCTLARYVLEKKCEAAQFLLANSNSTCTQIAMFLGFASCSHFTIRFKKVCGMTPEEYRKESYKSAVR